MKSHFHDSAYNELIDAGSYYEEREAGLGFTFFDAVDQSIQQIKSFPKAATLITDNLRKNL